jgi:KUP system potassium uptake protein
MMSGEKQFERGARAGTVSLTLGALGVVFGDIGTSPLYALRACFSGSYQIPLTPEHVLGILSLLFWSLLLVVSLKYLFLVARANNRGEGGGMAQLALIHRYTLRRVRGVRRLFVFLGVFGAALIFGDGALTPVISIVSAVEGLPLADPSLSPYVVPVSAALLTALFVLQRRGMGQLPHYFGPILLVWFVTLGVLGIRGIALEPGVLAALSPVPALHFLSVEPEVAFLVLTAVVLAITGAEVLYAEMGRFGIKPIRWGWFFIVLPSLVLNYFGQGALLLKDPTASGNPFYMLAPPEYLYPIIVLAICAAFIASQTLIAGVFSITQQAVQLGYLPRLSIRHTSASLVRQIYIPLVNWVLFGAVIWLLYHFRSTENLVNAYGLAVSSTMAITSALTLFVARVHWAWSWWRVVPLSLVLAAIDGAFLLANLGKFRHGGWFPMLVGVLLFGIMATWYRGRQIRTERLRSVLIRTERFMREMVAVVPNRLPGTGVFMARSPELVPPALLQNVRHHHVLHEVTILLAVFTEEVPYVPQDARIEIDPLGKGVYGVIVRYGFMDTPNIPEALTSLGVHGIEISEETTTYFLSRETLVATGLPGMAVWRERLFAFMARNAERAWTFFRIPSSRIVEIGLQIEL